MKRLGWAASSDPAELFGRRYDRVRAAYLDWMRRDYDVAWFAKAESYIALSDLVEAPSLVDLDDLEDVKLQRRLESGRWDSQARFVPALPRRWRYRIDAERWRAIQRRILSSATVTIVCSEADRARLGVSGVAVVPNGCTIPERRIASRRLGPPERRVILFHGFQLYSPNIEAAHLLAGRILPRVREQIANVQLRIVGRCDHRVMCLHGPPGVVVTGEVPDVAPELADADVVAVPIRYGSGSRLKILEAFAHEVPVVSTSVGADGLEVTHGEHLLVADDVEEFAAACVRVLRDASLRARLAENGRILVEQRYRWEEIQGRIAELAARASRGTRGSDMAC